MAKLKTQRARHAFRYRLDRGIRAIVMRLLASLAPRGDEADIQPRSQSIKKILVVRANFRMGNALLALPAITTFRKNFPEARIDFVGSPVSQSLFQGQRLNDHHITPRRFPHVLWQYPRLIRRLRGNRYDLAVDVSCSQSGAGAFIVGVSGSRIRAGMAGKWDRLFNLKVAKLRERNKYAKLAALLAALDLEEIDRVGALEFSATERIQALTRLNDITGKSLAKTVGICVGGRKLRGKRWPLENFAEVISRLQERGVGVVTFLGPEEKDLVETLPKSLPSVPVVLEPSLRKFAAIVAHLDLLICADSGPMHLACAVDVPVLAVFQPRNLKRWAPPAHAARSLSHPDGVSAAMVVAAALEMLSVERSPDDSPAPRVSSARPGI